MQTTAEHADPSAPSPVAGVGAAAPAGGTSAPESGPVAEAAAPFCHPSNPQFGGGLRCLTAAAGGRDSKAAALLYEAFRHDSWSLADDKHRHRLPYVVDCLQDPKRRLSAVRQIRKLLSVQNSPPIAEVLDTGCLPVLVDFMWMFDCDEAQFEAAWAVTNIASGDSQQTQTVLKHPRMLEAINALLARGSAPLVEQAVWCAGNLAGDNPSARDAVLASGVAPRLVQLLQDDGLALSARRNAIWTVSNLCRGKPPPPAAAMRPFLAEVVRHVTHSDDEVATDACWALSYLVEGPLREHVTPTGVVDQLVAKLRPGASSNQQKAPALRTLASLLSSTDDSETDRLLDAGVLPVLATCLNDTRRNIRREAAFALSNIMAGTAAQIQRVFDAGFSVRGFVDQITQSRDDVGKELTFALMNATDRGTVDHIERLVDGGVMEVIVASSGRGPRLLQSALEGLRRILDAGVEKTLLRFGGQDLKCGDQPLAEVGIGAQAVVELVSRPGTVPSESSGCSYAVMVTAAGHDGGPVAVEVGPSATVADLAARAAEQLEASDVQLKSSLQSRFAEAVEESGALDWLQDQQHNESEAIYRLSQDILTTYFGECEEGVSAG